MMSTTFGSENSGVQIQANHGPVYWSSGQPNAPQDIDDEVVKSLAFPNMLDRRDNIEPWHVNTCEWILELDEYQSWKSQPRGLLWIKGNPGAGKSTLMAFLYDHFEQEAAEGIRLDFFFSARGTELQRTPLGMLRSLLCQLFNCDITIRPKLRGMYEQRYKQLGKGNWEWPRVVLEKLLADTILESAGRQHVTVFIDALDEAGAESAQQLAAYFHRLIDRAGKVELHVCISCRHYPITRSTRAIEVHMEDHNRDDIAAYIKDTLIDPEFEESPSEDSGIEQSLVEQLIQQANGSFQWAHLIIPIAQRKILEGESFDEINRWLKEVPHDLEETYTYILCNVIEVSNRKQSLLLFQWVWLAERPLKVPEMRCALACGTAQGTSSSNPKPWKMTNGYIESDERMKRRIKALSGGLIDVVPSGDEFEIVQVIHQSVNDFLRARGIEILFSLVDTEELQVDCDTNDIVKRSHGTLYQSCLAYLAGMPAPQEIAYAPAGGEWTRLSDNYPLLTYATLFLFIHGEKSPAYFFVESLNEEVVDRWATLSDIRDRRNKSYPPCGTKLVHVAAASGLSDLIKSSSNEYIATKDRQGATALHLAARWGHVETGQALLEKGADLEAEDGLEKTPLMIAASYEHAGFVEWLLQAGANTQVRKGAKVQSALQAAADRGKIEIVRLLLNFGADVNVQGGVRGNALQAAAGNGYTEIVQLLLDSGADVNAQGGPSFYGNPLQAAARKGYNKVVQLLLNSGINVNSQGGTYGNALQAAALGGYTEIVQLLLDSGADINAEGGHYVNALQGAASPGHIEIVQLLLNYGADINAEGGKWGNALQVAASQGHTEIVQLLLNSGADISVEGSEYGNALQAAALGGYTEIVQLLLDSGADVNAQGGFFGHALQAATSRCRIERLKLRLDSGIDMDILKSQGGVYGDGAISPGHPEIVQLLLNSGADINAQGGEYGSALQGAASKGHTEIVQLLLNSGADINAEGGIHGSAVKAAFENGHMETAEMLEKLALT